MSDAKQKLMDKMIYVNDLGERSIYLFIITTIYGYERGVTSHSKIASSLSVIQAYEIKHSTNSFTVSISPAVINLSPRRSVVISIALSTWWHRRRS